jgi:integrase
MGKSYQKGWVVQRGKKWYGYYRRTVLDTESNKPKCKVKTVILGFRAQLSKYEAREALEREIEKATGASPGRNVRYDGSVTVGWFVRNRYYPLKRQDWNEDTAKWARDSIQNNFLNKFDDVPLENIDTYTLQVHLGELASTRSKPVVKHIRSYIRAIFGEAVDQKFLTEDPARRLKLPKKLRESDKTTLTWEQLRMVLASVDGWGRLVLETDMTLALRPSELFALTWKCLDEAASRLTIMQTICKGRIRSWGKTAGSLTDLPVPKGLMERFVEWRQRCPDPSPDAFIFHNGRRGLPSPDKFNARVLRRVARELGLPKLTFQVIRRTAATLAQRKGTVKDVQGLLRHSTPIVTAGVYMQIIPDGVQATVDSIYLELTGAAPQTAQDSKSGSTVTEETNTNVADTREDTTCSQHGVSIVPSPKEKINLTTSPDCMTDSGSPVLSTTKTLNLPTSESPREDTRAYPPARFEFVSNPSRRQNDNPRTVLVHEDQLSEPETSRERYIRERLYEEVWAVPMTTLAPRYGVSDRGLRKVCDRLQIPVPPMGYWNKVAAGKRVPPRPALARLQIINERGTRRSIPNYSTEEPKSIAAQSAAINGSVGETLTSTCPRLRSLDELPGTARQAAPDEACEEASAPDEPNKHRKNKVYSMTDIAVISRRILEAVSSGETLFNACLAEGINERTYREWRKRSGNPEYPFWDELIATALSEREESSEPEGHCRWLPRRRQHTKQDVVVILQQINDAVATGNTIRAMCRSVDIDLSTYYRWLRQLRKTNAGCVS